jgi:hypothetical protein
VLLLLDDNEESQAQQASERASEHAKHSGGMVMTHERI